MSRMRAVSAQEACRRNLEAAIDLFFRNGDEVAVHTLTSAAAEVANKLAGDTPRGVNIERDIRELLRPEMQQDVREIRSAAYNFFKHAGRLDATVAFNPDSTEHDLMDACSAFEAAIGRLPLIVVFRIWLRVKLRLADVEDPDLGSFADLREMSRPEFFAEFYPLALEFEGASADAIMEAERRLPPSPLPVGPRRRRNRRPRHG